MSVQKFNIKPSYKKDNGTWVLHMSDVNFPPSFIAQEQSIINIPAGKFGGNHKHPRTEAFIATSNYLQLVWQDTKGEIHTQQMKDNDSLSLFIIPPFIPHAVINTSLTQEVVLYEFADDFQHDVEEVILV